MREGWQLRETRWVGLRSGVWDASGDRGYSIKISDEILLSVTLFSFDVVRQTKPQASRTPDLSPTESSLEQPPAFTHRSRLLGLLGKKVLLKDRFLLFLRGVVDFVGLGAPGAQGC